MDDSGERITVPDMKKFVTDCFAQIGVNRTNSEIMAESIVGADIIGHRSHGVFRLDKFIADGYSGVLSVHAQPTIEKESSATAWVDGHNALGPVVGNFCMKLAIQKAKEVGAAIVVANNSNNPGVISYYSKQALEENMIGFAVSNSSPLMLPNRAKNPIAGTNPISLAAPALFGDYFLLDMATTVTSGGNVEIKYKNQEYLPVGWAVNASCLPETNADVALKTGCFLPLGSFEEIGSYKGTGLSIMVDILSGVLAGAHYSHMVGVWLGKVAKQKANIGHCFIVINPGCFASGFEFRMTEFMALLRNMRSNNPNEPVRIPGDKGREMSKSIEETGGIWYPKYVIDSLKNLSNTLKISCVPFIPKAKVAQMTSSEELAARLAGERGAESVEEVVFHEEIKRVSEITLEQDVSFEIEDSSDWLCSYTNAAKDRGKASKASLLLQEKTGRCSFTLSDSQIARNEESSKYSGLPGTVSEQDTLKTEQYDEMAGEGNEVKYTEISYEEDSNEMKVKQGDSVTETTHAELSELGTQTDLMGTTETEKSNT